MSLSAAPHFVVLYHTLLWEKRKRKPAANDENNASSAKNPTWKTLLWTPKRYPGRSLSDEKPSKWAKWRRRWIGREDVRSSWFTTISGTNRGELHQSLESRDGVPLPETKSGIQHFQSRGGRGLVLQFTTWNWSSEFCDAYDVRQCSNHPSAQQSLC